MAGRERARLETAAHTRRRLLQTYRDLIINTAAPCALEEGPMGSFVATDPMQQTTVSGVFACGDLARPAGSISLAVGDGSLAGAVAHQSLIFGSSPAIQSGGTPGTEPGD